MKAIVFDADGVLIGGKDSSGKYLWQKNIEADLGLNSTQMRQIFAGDWSLVLKGQLDSRVYFKSMFTQLNIGLDVDTFVEYWLKNDSIVNSEVLEVVKSIRGPKLYMGTNQDRLRSAVLQEIFGQYFDKIFSSYFMGAIKPEPEFFRYIETNLDFQAKDIAFIDDSKHLVDAAVQHGWIGHHYQDVEGLKQFIKEF